jgi:hypothetical protein
MAATLQLRLRFQVLVILFQLRERLQCKLASIQRHIRPSDSHHRFADEPQVNEENAFSPPTPPQG